MVIAAPGETAWHGDIRSGLALERPGSGVAGTGVWIRYRSLLYALWPHTVPGFTLKCSAIKKTPFVFLEDC